MKKALMLASLLIVSGVAVAAEDFKREIGAPKSGSFSHEQMKKAGELFDQAQSEGDSAKMQALINYFKPAKNPAAQKIAARWQDRLNALGVTGAPEETEAAPEEEAEAAPEEAEAAPAAPAPAPKPAAAPAAPAGGAGAGSPPVVPLPPLGDMNYSQLAFLFAKKQQAHKNAVGPNKAVLAKQIDQIRAEMAKKE